MRHSRSYRVISEFHLCIFAVSLFHVSLPGKTEKSAKPIASRLCGYKKRPRNRLSQRTVHIAWGLSFWWELVDSNHRSITQQIYSLSPLATRESSPIQFFNCNLADCSIIITKTFKKSKPIFQKSCFIAFLQQCFYKSHLYPSLLRSFCVEFLS